MRDDGLSMREHLLELRKRMTLAAFAVLIMTCIAFVFHQQLLALLMGPAGGFADIPNGKPIYTDLTEFISTAFKASLLFGVFGALPFVIYQVVRFVAPGLTTSEKRYLYALAPLCFLAFVAGAAFGYYVLFPPMVKFLLEYGEEIATPLIRIGSYVSLMMTLLFWMGIVFETPIVMFFLSKIGVLNHEFAKKQRRYAIVVAFILGAVITPTFDPINQSLVALPIIVLYEIGIWLAWLGTRGRRTAMHEVGADA